MFSSSQGLRKYSAKLKFKVLPGYTTKIEGAKTNEFRLSRTGSCCSDIQFNESDQVKLINYIIHREESFLNRKEKPLHDQSLIDEIQRILNEDNENADVNRPSKRSSLSHLSNRNAPNDSLNSSGRNSSARISSSSSSSADEENKNDDNNNDKNSNLHGDFIDTDYKPQATTPVKSDDNWRTIKGDFVMVYAVSFGRSKLEVPI